MLLTCCFSIGLTCCRHVSVASHTAVGLWSIRRLSVEASVSVSSCGRGLNERKRLFFLHVFVFLSCADSRCNDGAEHMDPTLNTTHCPTFFILSTADPSQQASTFAQRVMSDVSSGFTRTHKDGVSPTG